MWRGTLITNQTTKDKEILQHAIICEPRENSSAVFMAICCTVLFPEEGAALIGKKRITLMIAFWEELHVRDTGTMKFYRSMRYPDESRTMSGLDKLTLAGTLDAETARAVRSKLTTVGPVWKDLDARERTSKQCLSELSALPPLPSSSNLPALKYKF